MKTLKSKLVLIICSVCILCIFFSTTISYNVSKKIILEEKEKSIFYNSEKYSKIIDEWLISQGKMIDEMVNDLVYYNNFETENLLGYFIEKQKRNPYIVCFYMGFEDKRMISGDGWIPPDEYDCTQRDWYTKAIENFGLTYTAPYLDATTNKMIISIARPVAANGEVIGVVGTDIYVDYLTEIVDEASKGGEGYAFLIDDNNNIIVHENYDYYPTESGTHNIVEILDARFESIADDVVKKKSGMIKDVVDYDGKEKFIIYSSVESASWIFGFAISEKLIFEPLVKLFISYILVSLFAMLISCISAFALISKFVRPILEITEYSKNVASGNLTKIVNIRTNDEIGILAKSYNKMIGSLKSSIENMQSSSGKINKHIVEIKSQFSRIEINSKKLIAVSRKLNIRYRDLSKINEKEIDVINEIQDITFIMNEQISLYYNMMDSVEALGEHTNDIKESLEKFNV